MLTRGRENIIWMIKFASPFINIHLVGNFSLLTLINEQRSITVIFNSTSSTAAWGTQQYLHDAVDWTDINTCISSASNNIFSRFRFRLPNIQNPLMYRGWITWKQLRKRMLTILFEERLILRRSTTSCSRIIKTSRASIIFHSISAWTSNYISKILIKCACSFALETEFQFENAVIEGGT